jgi:hypothetical protein
MNQNTTSLFDPQSFLESTEVTGEMSTKRVLCPIGRYNMQIDKYEAKRINKDDGTSFCMIDFSFIVDGGSLDATGLPVKDSTGSDKNFARMSGFLDFTESGALDLGTGKNITLGQIRAACGQNDPSRPWSIKSLVGQVVNGEVYHRQDKKNPENFYPEVRNLLPAN